MKTNKQLQALDNAKDSIERMLEFIDDHFEYESRDSQDRIILAKIIKIGRGAIVVTDKAKGK